MDAIVFDMDGVLADVTESYRAAIQATVRHFTGQDITADRVQEYKNSGGWNNDWALSQRISADLGRELDYETVVAQFQQLFFSGGEQDLILRERWIPRAGLLDELAANYRLSIFTGRPRKELEFTLNRWAPTLRFAPVVTCDDVCEQKPHPEGLLAIVRQFTGGNLFYVGDTVDDARCAHAAGVPFIGIASADSPLRDDLVRLFEQERAIAIISTVNEIQEVLSS